MARVIQTSLLLNKGGGSYVNVKFQNFGSSKWTLVEHQYRLLMRIVFFLGIDV